MTIDASTAVALDALADELKAATAPNADFDARLLAAITPVMQEIEQRSPATGFRYTLNVTNALQLRAKKWYLKGMMEIGQVNQPFASCWFEYEPQLGFVQGGTGSVGASLGLSTCAAICHVWAEIVRRYIVGNYPGTV